MSLEGHIFILSDRFL